MGGEGLLGHPPLSTTVAAANTICPDHRTVRLGLPAEDPAATVLADEQVLAAVLRGRLRAHADAFLVGYDPGVRLPRRALLGVLLLLPALGGRECLLHLPADDR